MVSFRNGTLFNIKLEQTGSDVCLLQTVPKHDRDESFLYRSRAEATVSVDFTVARSFSNPPRSVVDFAMYARK